MKIAHLIDSGGMYGAENVLITLCRSQIAAGLSPCILSCGLPGQGEKPLETVAKSNGIDVKTWRMKSGINLSGFKEIVKWLHEEGVDIVHSHGYKFNILFALSFWNRKKMNLISTVHGYVNSAFPSKIWFYEALDRIALKSFDRVVFVDKRTASRRLVRWISKERIAVIHNGIELSGYETEVAPWRSKTKVKNLLAVGRLSREKGFDTLISAMAELESIGAGYRLTIIGSGALYEDLVRRAKEECQSDQLISFLGYKDNAHKFYAHFDAFILPSRTEGIPITILEALREGMPCFASCVGGIPEIIQSKQDFLFEPNDPHAIVQKIQRWNALTEQKRHQRLQESKRHFQQSFSSSEMAKKYIEEYESLIGSRKGEK